MYVERKSFKNGCLSSSCASHSLDTDTIVHFLLFKWKYCMWK